MAILSQDGTRVLNLYNSRTGASFNARLYPQLPSGVKVDNGVWFKNPKVINEKGEVVALGGYAKREQEGGYPITMFGVKGDGSNDAGAVNHMLEVFRTLYDADIPSATQGKILGGLNIDLCGLRINLDSVIKLSGVNGNYFGGFTFSNGTFTFGDNLRASGSYAFEPSNCEGIAFDKVYFIGDQDKVAGTKVFNVGESTVGIHFNQCHFYNVEKGIYGHEHAYEIVITKCRFRNFGATKAIDFIDVFGDAIINGGNVFVGASEQAIKTRAGGNIITGNHIYTVTSGIGVNCKGNSVGSLIQSNYFDGVALHVASMGYQTNITGNWFQRQRTYSPIKIYNDAGQSVVASNINVSDNNIHFNKDFTPVVEGISILFNGSNSVTVTGLELSQKHIGGVLVIDADRILQIRSVNGNIATVKVVLYTTPTAGNYTGVSLMPYNIFIDNGATKVTMLNAANIYIIANTIASDNSTGSIPIRPFRLDNVNYERSDKNLDNAYSAHGFRAYSIFNDSNDNDAIRFMNADGSVFKGRIGHGPTYLRFVGGPLNTDGVILTQTSFRPEATDSGVSLGTNGNKFKNVFGRYGVFGDVIGVVEARECSYLEINGTTRGMLPPRLTTVQRDAIPSKVKGLFLYNNDTDTIDTYNGVEWASLAKKSDLPARGTFVVAGTGQTTINIPHGLGVTPSYTLVVPKSRAAVDAKLSWTETSTHLILTVITPNNGGTLTYSWEAYK